MKSAFQKVSAITVAVVALALVPVTAGTASAEEPGWQSPVARVGETVTDVLGEPGWQDVPNEPGWQNLPADSTE
ncbi:hypothetical protein [Streptomyces sp. DG1A-41]|jgi:hypothetical protein|uniref:hypothetical protein n=1 Tax=Streptomyces sp. DG1A-41 TaxID=3125779 RepID=UPI0030D0B96F